MTPGNAVVRIAVGLMLPMALGINMIAGVMVVGMITVGGIIVGGRATCGKLQGQICTSNSLDLSVPMNEFVEDTTVEGEGSTCTITIVFILGEKIACDLRFCTDGQP